MIGEIKLEYYDTIIVGAGLAGCTLGNLLLKENKKVVIIENQDLNKKINYGLYILGVRLYTIKKEVKVIVVYNGRGIMAKHRRLAYTLLKIITTLSISMLLLITMVLQMSIKF